MLKACHRRSKKWDRQTNGPIMLKTASSTTASENISFKIFNKNRYIPSWMFWFLSCGFKKMTKFQSCSDYLSQQNPSQVQQTAKSLSGSNKLICLFPLSSIAKWDTAKKTELFKKISVHAIQTQQCPSRILEIMQNLDCVGNCLKTKKCKLPNLDSSCQ